MTETFKIGRACFIGGVVCVAIALLVVPTYWLLGLLGGVAGGFLSGYITFDFAEVRRKVPEALRRAKADTNQAFVAIADAVKRWASKPHPFLPMVLVLVALYLWSVFALIDVESASRIARGKTPVDLVDYIITPLLWAIMTVAFPFMGLAGLVWTGAQRVDRVYWVGFPHDISAGIARMKGLRRVSLTYLNIYAFAIKGLIYWIIQSVIFLCWRMWKYAVIGLWLAGSFVARFFWHLFKLVHSQQRLLCGVDGTLGGLIALVGFYLYGPVTPTPTEYLTVALFGGLIGAALGIANWELVSKRMFGYGVNSV